LHQVLVSHLIGGAAVVAIRLAAAAKTRGLRTVAWIPGEGPAASEIDRLGVRRRGYDLDALKGSQAARLVSCARIAVALMGSWRPIVHVHNPAVFGMLRPALQAARARAVVHFQIEASPGEIEWTLESPPAHIVTCAKYIAAAVADAARRLEVEVPISAVPNAVDLDRFVPGDREAARARLGMGDGRFIVLMLANLAPHKGQSTTLRAVRSLVDRGVAVECWLVGEDRETGGRYGQELRSLAASLGLADTVRFLGFRRDGPVLLQAADAFVLPSTHEGLPLSILEAQACRVPVVGSDIPGIREVVDDGKTGFVVPAGDHEGYADRLATLHRHASVRDRLTEAAQRQVVRDYSFAALEERMFSIYRSVAAGRSSD
jgi:glycosyltransferase involved in cell wall biosynthesis